MKTKTIQFRANPDGDWMSMGVSHIIEGSFDVPTGMDCDYGAGRMRWDPKIKERDFEKREITFEYEILVPVENPHKGKMLSELTKAEKEEILFGHLLDKNGKFR